ncbi:beta-ketoacyl synthase N-terminal-like domain-containing protein [Nguyenibacter vanlangensis]|uniref:Beta-ketoacyl-[acyl-carrier-protein] synthase family protein n=1 Tax=Nguyenibacter vanlangensis TaxID=1216886 RepID=A0A7Y7ITH6_9PROT|nr:beta-ketoacyl synthase N-terminal-like domain-containing protein [Nguyenibacter vanlangensis]NVN10069.1 beta-ketoacyl-[acyl-carrier-protein] synthase family protein [Nguyenibacter vanlangensis]
MTVTAGVAAWSIATPLGNDEDALAALFAGQCGISRLESPFPLRNDRAGIISSVARNDATLSEWQRQLGKLVGQRAISRAGIDPCDPKTGYVFATSYGHLLDEPGHDTMSSWAEDCVKMLGGLVAPVVVGTACSAGSDALGIASALLAGGQYDAVVVVAVDIVTIAKRLAHSGLGTMTDTTPKPFDIERNGMIVGDAAAAVVLRPLSLCKNSCGVLLGYGASNDAAGLTAPDQSGESVELAIRRALMAASTEINDVSVYLAHGTSTHLNDLVESKVIGKIFPKHSNIKLYGTKGALGHSLGACGLLEFIILVDVLRRRSVPPSVGLTVPIEEVSEYLPLVASAPTSSSIGLSVTLGFGGFNTALLGKWEER